MSFEAKSFVKGEAKSADYSDNLANAGQIISFYQAPSKGEVAFKAFLTNFQDSYKSNWNRTSVYGKMDPISMFQNTQRTITLSWDVVASSPYEAKENLRRVGLLTQMLYPGYDKSARRGVGFIDNAPVFKVKFMNLITDPTTPGAASAQEAGLMCTIDGFDNQVDTTAGFIMLKDTMYPKVIKMSCVLYILHTHKLGFDGQGNLRTPDAPYGQSATTATNLADMNKLSANQGKTPLTQQSNTNTLTASKKLTQAIDLQMTTSLLGRRNEENTKALAEIEETRRKE